MKAEATIFGTREGFYLACLDEERDEYDCNGECLNCPHPCRVLVYKEQPLEKGRRLLVRIEGPLAGSSRKLIPILLGIYIGVFVILFLILKFLLPFYKSLWPPFLGGFFAAALFYLLLRLREEKSSGGNKLRKARIIRVFQPDGHARPTGKGRYVF